MRANAHSPKASNETLDEMDIATLNASISLQEETSTPRT